MTFLVYKIRVVYMYADVAYATVQLIGGDADIDDGLLDLIYKH